MNVKSTPGKLACLIAVAFAMGALYLEQRHPTMAPSHSSSVLVQARADNNFIFPKAASAPHACTLPAPLDHPSEQELIDFPGSSVVEAEEIEDPQHPGERIRMRMLKTNFKSPYVRTEEMIDANSGALLGRAEMAGDHFLLNLPEGSDPQELFDRLGPEVTSMSPVVPGSSLWRANLANSSLSVLPNLLYQAVGVGEPDLIYGIDDPFSWNHLVNQQWALPMISAPNVPKNIRKSGDKGTIVAVIDTGIRYTHKDLQQNMWINPDPNAPDRYGINAVAATNDPMDDCGHGTHCAGIIGATGIGMEGIAPQGQLMACKFLDAHGQGLLSDEIVCLHYAIDHGATVLNCSYGKALGVSKDGFSVSMPFSLFSQAEYDTMKYVGKKGGVITIAAGNNSSSNDTFPLYPASYSVAQSYIAKLKEDTLWGKKWHEPIIRTAAALDNIVSVAATDEQDQLSPFSNYGAESVSIAAPGSNILSTWGSSDTSYVLLSGTSMAAPHVAGALALMQAQFPERSSQELIAHLLETADATPSLKGKTRSGRLNLLRALTWDE